MINVNTPITDPKLLARVRKLIREEHAGFVEKNSNCVEPGCSCWESWQGEGDPVSGPFRDPPVRCSSFEENVLPLDPDLEEAYWRHLDQGQALSIPRCAWRDSTGRKCRREVSTPKARYCEGHALLARRKAQREYKARKVRESKITPLGPQ